MRVLFLFSLMLLVSNAKADTVKEAILEPSCRSIITVFHVATDTLPLGPALKQMWFMFEGEAIDNREKMNRIRKYMSANDFVNVMSLLGAASGVIIDGTFWAWESLIMLQVRPFDPVFTKAAYAIASAKREWDREQCGANQRSTPN